MSAGGDAICVLHVDEDERLLETTARLLEEADDRIAVTTAAGPERALERLEGGGFDCVVSDYDMAEMDGLELFEAVRDRHPELPFILYTGKGNEAVAAEAVTAGVTDYLRKSTDANQYELLANRITNAVESARTERRLEAERRRFRELFEHFPEPTIAYVYEDGEPHITRVNEAFTDVFGYDASRAVGTAVDDLLVPPDRRSTAERIDERVRAGDRVDEHLRRRTADDVRDFRFRNIELPDDDHVDGYAIYADITDRLERERERKRHTDLFREAQDLADVGAWAYDPHADELEWTEQVYAIHDVDPSYDPTIETALEFYHPDDRDAVGRAVERALANEDRYEVQARIVTAEDRVRWVQTHGRPVVEDGDVVSIRGAIQDVTSRQEQLETIRELQHRSQRLIRAGAPDRAAEIAVDIASAALDVPIAGVHLVDDEARVLEPVAFTYDGHDGADAAPSFQRNDPDRTVERLTWGVFQAGEPSSIQDTHEHDPVDEAETPARSGALFPLGDHGVFFAAATEPGALTETDRYLVDILATVLTAALDRTERERALRDQKELLEARTDRLDELVSVISHDLQSPLNVADGRLDLARTECDSRHLDDAASAVDRSRAIVEDLLALAREGDREADPTPVTLPSIAEDCWVSVASGDAVLDVEADGVILADLGRVRQLLENLFRNAVTHGGGDHDEGSVTVTVGDLAEGFYVADDGVGIPPEEREDVFESGYTSGDGTGLGLSIVEQVAREHGWDVTLTESDAGGTRFEFTGVDRPDP